jgi:hypothetical protein
MPSRRFLGIDVDIPRKSQSTFFIQTLSMTARAEFLSTPFIKSISEKIHCSSVAVAIG